MPEWFYSEAIQYEGFVAAFFYAFLFLNPLLAFFQFYG
jgi:hypothetical protein